MNNFIHAINGFNQWKVYYTDTDSLFIPQSSYEILKQKGFVGNDNFQGKNDLNTVHMFNCNEVKQHKIKTISSLCESEKCECLHWYEAENQIIEAYFAGPKQKWVIIKDINSDLIQEKITLKGIPLKIKNGKYITDVIDKNYFKKLIQANRDNEEVEIVKIEYTDKLKRSIENGITTYDISKKISVEKYREKMTLIGNHYIPKVGIKE